jgi:ribosome biogenesis GTPase
MDLLDLGYDHWFVEKYNEMNILDCRPARVSAVYRDNYQIINEIVEVNGELSGRFVFSADSYTDYPCVGDWVLAQYYNSDTSAIIHKVFPRKSYLRRKAAGKIIDYQMIAANIDVGFIMQSCDVDFNLRRLERYLIMIRDGNIEPVIVLTKSDLATGDKLSELIEKIKLVNIDCMVISLSNMTGEGLELLKSVLISRKTYCLIGSSGVGKTTLLNNLIGKHIFETKTVRESDGRGRHATSHRQMVILEKGSMIIDTPGMRELANIGVNTAIRDSFPEIEDLSVHCKFSNCTHTSESGCSVMNAVLAGDLSEERLQSYKKLKKESEYYEMSYIKRREKDRKFGRFIAGALKQIKKYES